MSHCFGKFIWFEHVSDDVEAARGFYASLFGWNTTVADMGKGGSYYLIQNARDGIGGFRRADAGVPNHWRSYLSVPDVEAAAAAAQAAGGRILMPPRDYPPAGRGATLADPFGAVFSVWTNSGGDRPDTRPIAVGDWCWNELMTPDEAAALAFYEQAFGFTHEDFDMVPQGVYHVLAKDGVQRAGLMKCPRPNMPSAWLPYVRVTDCDACMRQAGSLGARPVMEAVQIDKVGRICAFLDPTGAALAILQPQE